MKLKLKATEQQMELIKAIGSRDLSESRKAQEMLAGFIAQVIGKVLLQASTVNAIYSDLPYNEDDDPSIPLELFYDQTNTQWVTVWSQAIAGGLPTSQLEGVAEMKISTYRLDSAVSFLKKYARRSRLDVIAKAVERMAQELLIKQERNGWAVILRALAEASTNSSKHLVTANTLGVFQLDEMNRLMTLLRRMNTSWAGGTPTSLDSYGLTDLFVSPEIKEQIRSFAYNPMNTSAGVTPAGGTASTVGIPLPEPMRQQIYNSAGMSEIYGVALHELNELGLSQKYNTLFAAYSPGSVAPPNTGKATFDATLHQVLVGFDLGRECFFRPIAQNADNGASITTMVDDQWVIRSEKAGYYTALEEGRICIDAKGVCGIVV